MTDKPKIYLDYAAATPLAPEVLELMQPYFVEKFYNPSAIYGSALSVHKDLEEARKRVAYWLGARSSEIIFTAGGSEANNLAIHGIMQQYPDSNLVISSIEHESVLSASRRYKNQEVKVDKFGQIDLNDLDSKIDDGTVLVSLMYANNEIGSIESISKISALIKDKKKQRKNNLPLYFHTDACQAANYLDLHVARLGVDMMTINGGKIYGPKQSAVLFVDSKVNISPIIDGGGQERGIRNGTENVAADIGLSFALEIAQSTRNQESERLKILQNQFIDGIEKLIPEGVINGPTKHRLPNNVHATFPGTDNERLLFQLDQKGIMSAAGSACSASNEEPSHVLKAIGLSDQTAQSSLRFTLGRATTAQEIEYVVKTLKILTMQ